MAAPVRLFSLPLLLAALSLPALAAAPPTSPSMPPPTDFGEAIDVRVVNVEAVVTDRSGRRVSGLTAADFQLLVDGREVPIDYFTEVTDGAAVPAPTPAGASAAAAPAAPAAGAVGRSLLVFVDEVFAIQAHLAIVLDRLEQDLDRLAREDRVAVVAYDGTKLDVLTDWTGDRAAIRAALAAARRRPAHGIEVRAERERMLDDEDLRVDAAWSTGLADPLPRVPLLLATPPAPADMAAGQLGFGTPSPASTLAAALTDAGPITGLPWQAIAKLHGTGGAVVAALRGFAAVPGRKAALLLSGGWPVALQPGLFPRIVETANLLGYTLYPVDVPGIESSPVPHPASSAGPRSAGADYGLISSPWELDVHYGLETLARKTGGKAALNGNRLEALPRALDDTRSYYWLGFSPARRGDNRRHDIRVAVRRPGLAARARQSFTDLSRASESAMQIEGMLLLGRGQQEKRLLVELGAPRRSGLRDVEVALTLGVPVDSLTPQHLADGWRIDVPLHVTALDASGDPVDLPPLVLRLDTAEPPPATGYARFQTTLRVRGGERALRFTVLDPVKGTLLWGEGEIAHRKAQKR